MTIIPRRSGLEVFVNNLGTITIRQADEGLDEGEPIVVVHPDDVSALVKALDRARREAKKVVADEQREHEDVTVPELYARWRSGSA